MTHWKHIIRGVILSIIALTLGCAPNKKNQVNVAVATNFYMTALELESVFEAKTDLNVSVISGSTGQLYAQIINGAPYDIFLAADTIRPGKLITESLAQDEFTYAIGRLVLWNREEDTPSIGDLTQTDYRHLAIANPALAPYGLASQEVISSLDISDRIVMGENIGQTFSLVESGNAEFGFISLSQIIARGSGLEGTYLIVPDPLYTPIIQDAVLLNHGRHNPDAKAFYAFLKSETARDIIKEAGYNLPDGT